MVPGPRRETILNTIGTCSTVHRMPYPRRTGGMGPGVWDRGGGGVPRGPQGRNAPSRAYPLGVAGCGRPLSPGALQLRIACDVEQEAPSPAAQVRLKMHGHGHPTHMPRLAAAACSALGMGPG